MQDPYLYEGSEVLKNKLNIHDADLLERAESDITYIKLLDIDKLAAEARFDLDYLKQLHKYIFGDLYQWAGELRTIPMVKGERVLGGDTVRYCDPHLILEETVKTLTGLHCVNWPELGSDETADRFAKLVAELWQIHPFREGNTRSIITFATQFAQRHGFEMDKQMLRENAAYVRDALVKACDGPYSDYQYLRRIFKDAIIRT